MKNKLPIISLIISVFACTTLFGANSMNLSDGYVLCGAYSGTSTLLIDKNGNPVHTWDHSTLPDSMNGYVVYLLENGNILRTAQVSKARGDTFPPGSGPIQGIVEEIDPNGAVVWKYKLSNDTFMMHHDIKPLSNGHFIAVTFDAKTIDDAKKVGVDTALFPRRNPKLLLSERIIEVNPRATKGQEIVWQWSLWDHITPKSQAAEHWELFNGSAGTPSGNQWVHLNGITICEKRKLIVFTSRLFSELFIIDYGTTTAQAAGHTGGLRGKGGDFLYRWGNPTNYDSTSTQRIHVLHCPTWIPDDYPGGGHVMFFHNNMVADFSTTGASQVVELELPLDGNGCFIKSPGVPFGPPEPFWLYAPAADTFYSMAMSSAFRLANGNTLIHEAYPPEGRNGRLREVTKDQQLLWKYDLAFTTTGRTGGGWTSGFNPAKIMYYPSNYRGIDSLFRKTGIIRNGRSTVQNRSCSRIRYSTAHARLTVDNAAGAKVRLFTCTGKTIALFHAQTNREEFATGLLPPGLYLATVLSSGRAAINQTILIP
jgi:hypothetical protein